MIDIEDISTRLRLEIDLRNNDLRFAHLIKGNTIRVPFMPTDVWPIRFDDLHQWVVYYNVPEHLSTLTISLEHYRDYSIFCRENPSLVSSIDRKQQDIFLFSAFNKEEVYLSLNSVLERFKEIMDYYRKD